MNSRNAARFAEVLRAYRNSDFKEFNKKLNFAFHCGYYDFVICCGLISTR